MRRPTTPGGKTTAAAGNGFRHEAAFYADDAEFLSATVPFVLDGINAGEPIMVALARRTDALLRRELGRQLDSVRLLEMESVGRNPSCIIPAWRQFVQERPPDGRPIRGIGEPVWPGRTSDELAECHLHEALLNDAFARTPAFSLMCPYDTGRLGEEVVQEARTTHPVLSRSGESISSLTYGGEAASALRFERPLGEPATVVADVAIDGTTLPASLPPLRHLIAAHAASCGLDRHRCDDLVVAADEIIVNAVRHGGGRGRLRLWCDGDRMVCEVRDVGHLGDPMVGRRLPDRLAGGGRGLWIVNRLCDLVQIRSDSRGTTVRIHVGP